MCLYHNQLAHASLKRLLHSQGLPICQPSEVGTDRLLRNTPIQALAHLSLSPWALDTYNMLWSPYGLNGWRIKSPQYLKILGKKNTAHDGSMCLVQIMNLKQVCNSINTVCVSAKCIPNSIWDLWGLHYERRLLSASFHHCMGTETERGIPWELH